MIQFFHSLILSSLSIADIILNPVHTIINIAKKNANTLKNDKICKNKLFCRLLTKSADHETFSIFNTKPKIQMEPYTKNEPYAKYIRFVAAFFPPSAPFKTNPIPATTANTNISPNVISLIIFRKIPPVPPIEQLALLAVVLGYNKFLIFSSIDLSL